MEIIEKLREAGLTLAHTNTAYRRGIIGSAIKCASSEIDRLTNELAEARADVVRLRSYNEGLAKISAGLERERDEAIRQGLVIGSEAAKQAAENVRLRKLVYQAAECCATEVNMFWPGWKDRAKDYSTNEQKGDQS